MSALVDPRICPDCRAPLSESSVCTGCGLALTGPKAGELWRLLQRADALIAELRQAPAGPVATGPLPPAPPVALPPRRPARLPSFSVPVLLLGLGALCVLVAAVVFVAVAWGSLGLGAKATILLGVTAAFTGVAATVTRRGLRGAAETFWLIVASLIAVDLAAAYGADLAGLGGLDARHAVAAVGIVELVLAVAVGSWVPSTPTRRLVSLVGLAGVGTLLVTGAEAFAAERPAVAVTIAIALIVGLAAALASAPSLRPTSYAVALNAVLAGAVLIGIGVERSVGTPVADWWRDLQGWPLLVAAGYAGLLAGATRLPVPVRMAGATAALLSLAALALGGEAGATATLTTAAGVAVALAVVSGVTGRIWAVPAGVMTLAAGTVSALLCLSRPWDALGTLPTTGPARGTNLDLRIPPVLTDLAPWTALVVAAVVVISALGLLRHLPGHLPGHLPATAQPVARRQVVALGAPVLGLGAATLVLETEPRIALAVLCWAAVLLLAGGAAVATREYAPGLVAALGLVTYLSVLGLRLAAPSHLLAALLATAIAVGLGAGYTRSRPEPLAGALLPFLAGAGVLAAGFAATHWPYLLGGDGDTAGLTLAVLAAAALLGARASGRTEDSRRTVELVAVVLGLATTGFTNTEANDAIALTVLGAALALVSIRDRDRDLLGWGAAVVLGIATVLRLHGQVDAPELYTLPIAVLLLAGGTHRLRTDPAISSVRALGSGLVLGLVPSLLLALDDPVTLRGALIGAAGVLVLGAGVRVRWAAPFLAGAAVVAVLAVRHLGPVADAVPRWVSLGSVGVLFLLVGITWEARRRNLATAERYLASLR